MWVLSILNIEIDVDWKEVSCWLVILARFENRLICWNLFFNFTIVSHCFTCMHICKCYVKPILLLSAVQIVFYLSLFMSKVLYTLLTLCSATLVLRRRDIWRVSYNDIQDELRLLLDPISKRVPRIISYQHCTLDYWMPTPIFHEIPFWLLSANTFLYVSSDLWKCGV